MSNTVRIYFDHNATTPLAPEVVDGDGARAPRRVRQRRRACTHFGQRAKAALDEARARWPR